MLQILQGKGYNRNKVVNFKWKNYLITNFMFLIYLILIIIGGMIVWFITTYNKFIALKNRAKEAWADIDVQLKRRHNLIPNLVETVKGYAGHEKGVFEKVTEARAGAMKAGTLADKTKAENKLSNTLKSLFAVAENYPQLKASGNFQKLQDELTNTEDKIQIARRFYNGSVRDYNIKRQSSPSNIVASLFKFGKIDFFEVEDKEVREPVKVKF